MGFGELGRGNVGFKVLGGLYAGYGVVYKVYGN